MPSPAKLADQLKDQLAWCRRHPEQRNRLKLGHGLRITVYVDQIGDAHVLLARDGAKGPSDQEAKTVLDKWPEARPPEISWTRGKGDKVSWMAATLAAPKQLGMF